MSAKSAARVGLEAIESDLAEFIGYPEHARPISLARHGSSRDEHLEQVGGRNNLVAESGCMGLGDDDLGPKACLIKIVGETGVIHCHGVPEDLRNGEDVVFVRLIHGPIVPRWLPCRRS